ncbi:uncharacterized protein NECHADRAFT_47695 [Fusarium vanettenii 77-13-4]|uniref:HpcH/HpaI aldolase/citrate lyase domain-containing protein n=1 Tax=Fusarium vanettenii (strain ATCC MYA-4622 / CBS 123669 / FGSC 9596 / NRRL 45880 / 77-13-4) TaxID=660122 RepID=C7YZT6_FUSV7|nr:uncharacterized protein NECHADRAFT_47695 [Fusarium vanettenii 77-13-4]EEU42665.1 hypothetical protein NECHADRAFT_47695 [Fusarium vanettenii 77-13-4]
MSTMQAANRLWTALSKGRQSFGAWQMIRGANVSRVLARTGVDWVLVDCEHGDIDDGAMHEAVPAIADAGVSPIVRPPGMEGWMIKRALDSGAHGVLIPLIETVEEVKKVVKAAKFPPRGRRGFGSPYAQQRFNPSPTFIEYLHQANDATLVIVQIETKEALEAVDEIAAVDGVDVLFIGPFDLGNNIGHPIISSEMAPQLRDAIAKVLKASHKHGKKCGIYTSGGQQAKVFADQGFDMISVATDHTSLDDVVKGHLSVASATAKPDKGVSY